MKLTREEAIKQFETLLLHVDTDCVIGMETTEAINMAIKALEQLEPCEDVISRQEAIDLLKQMRKDGDMIPWEGKDVFARIRKLPSAQPKRGKWIMDRSGAYCCSECMEPCAGYVMMKPRDKYCKMCGSRNEVTE